MTPLYWVAFAVAFAAWGAAVLLVYDARRQKRRREDRAAYREFMAGRWHGMPR